MRGNFRKDRRGERPFASLLRLPAGGSHRSGAAQRSLQEAADLYDPEDDPEDQRDAGERKRKN